MVAGHKTDAGVRERLRMKAESRRAEGQAGHLSSEALGWLPSDTNRAYEKLQYTSTKVVMMLVSRPTMVMRFGAIQVGMRPTSHSQYGCMIGSSKDRPALLYRCSSNRFSWCRERGGACSWISLLRMQAPPPPQLSAPEVGLQGVSTAGSATRLPRDLVVR
ncbi:hypothetical protein JZ751_007583 [Albula glossodonta]|uniref:Uncharacterized protein n=1 Tax=Albula glossodonta TaxID=121402 RepID=A0A8T2N520_9TELE|nr:hypothetical protein JZ751_007583 [Albula glossodonta]